MNFSGSRFASASSAPETVAGGEWMPLRNGLAGIPGPEGLLAIPGLLPLRLNEMKRILSARTRHKAWNIGQRRRSSKRKLWRKQRLGAYASWRCVDFWPEFRNPNPRNPKEARTPKPETYRPVNHRNVPKAPSSSHARSALGFRISCDFASGSGITVWQARHMIWVGHAPLEARAAFFFRLTLLSQNQNVTRDTLGDSCLSWCFKTVELLGSKYLSVNYLCT